MHGHLLGPALEAKTASIAGVAGLRSLAGGRKGPKCPRRGSGHGYVQTSFVQIGSLQKRILCTNLAGNADSSHYSGDLYTENMNGGHTDVQTRFVHGKRRREERMKCEGRAPLRADRSQPSWWTDWGRKAPAAPFSYNTFYQLRNYPNFVFLSDNYYICIRIVRNECICGRFGPV